MTLREVLVQHLAMAMAAVVEEMHHSNEEGEEIEEVTQKKTSTHSCFYATNEEKKDLVINDDKIKIALLCMGVVEEED